MKVQIKDIEIGERQRIDLGDPLNDLASIGDAEVGLINPVTLEQKPTGDYKLLAGRRRLEWHIRSGKTDIEATIKGQMSELSRQKIELLEDIERKDRSWQEECLAFAKLFNLIRLEKMQRNENWTLRAMARFTGQDKNIIHYSIEIAKMLKVEPRDNDMWSCRNYTDALKLIVDRNYKLANDELEKRRQLWQQREAAARVVTEPVAQVLTGADYVLEEAPTPEFVSALSAVPEQDNTPPRTKVFIHGLNMAFEDAVPGVHFIAEHTQTALAWKPNQYAIANIIKALKPTGLAVLWYTSENFGMYTVKNDFVEMPWCLIWNRIAMGTASGTWPFENNYSEGWLVCKEPSSIPNSNPSGSVISCLPEGDELPYPVVEWCLRAIDTNNLAVLCPCNAPVLSVAMTGRIPIWFEADKAKFDAKVQELREYYLDNVPNCDVFLRKVDSTGDWSSEQI